MKDFVLQQGGPLVRPISSLSRTRASVGFWVTMKSILSTPAGDGDHLPIGVLREVGPDPDLRSVAFLRTGPGHQPLNRYTPGSFGRSNFPVYGHFQMKDAAGFDLHLQDGQRAQPAPMRF